MIVFLVPAAACCAYLLVLTLLSARRRPPAPVAPALRFDVIVPAHDEEAGISRTVQSLFALDWPRELLRVVVVADNCTDATAERARTAGADVLVREDPGLRGKGYALEHAFERMQGDAAVVVDADTLVSPNLLHAFAARLASGAMAVQADYAVSNPDASWRTRLMAIAFGAFHQVRSLGRERLGLSCGLRGNGMCFSRALLAKVPHRAFSLVEDVEYGICIGEAGHRVHYAGEAQVLGEMVPGEKGSRSQRQRWEGGRLGLLRAHAPRLLGEAVRRRDRVLFDLALDLLVPPLWVLALWVALGLGAALALHQLHAAWAACALALTLYVLRGWALSGTGAKGFFTLLAAPLFVAWKLALMVRRAPRNGPEWVRTARKRAPR